MQLLLLLLLFFIKITVVKYGQNSQIKMVLFCAKKNFFTFCGFLTFQPKIKRKQKYIVHTENKIGNYLVRMQYIIIFVY